jgi:hypothetical protein
LAAPSASSLPLPFPLAVARANAQIALTLSIFFTSLSLFGKDRHNGVYPRTIEHRDVVEMQQTRTMMPGQARAFAREQLGLREALRE